MERFSIYDNTDWQPKDSGLPKMERDILECLLKYRNPKDKPLDEEALNTLNVQCDSLEAFMNRVFVISGLQDAGYIHGVNVVRNNDSFPFDSVHFTAWSYITLEGIKYLKENS